MSTLLLDGTEQTLFVSEEYAGNGNVFISAQLSVDNLTPLDVYVYSNTGPYGERQLVGEFMLTGTAPANALFKVALPGFNAAGVRFTVTVEPSQGSGGGGNLTYSVGIYQPAA